MRPDERRENIVRLVHKTGEISVEQLAFALGASRETIRRDLATLDAGGRLKKFHGGARMRSPLAAEPAAEGPFALRMAENLAAKRRIAHAAARLLSPGDAVFIDTGTTTLVLAEALVALPALVVITNASKIAAVVSSNPEHTVFLIGGAYSPDAGETLGRFALEQLRHFRARHAFLTVGAADETGVMDFDAEVSEVARTMMARADSVTVLADSSKFARHGIFEVARWAQIDTLVTEALPPRSMQCALEEAGTRIVLA